MEKRDLVKELKEFYLPPKGKFVLVEVPKMNFLAVDGRGDPNTSQDFKDAIGALYSVAYTLKFTFKKERGLDWKVMPLEGLWWTDEMGRFTLGAKDEWRWTVMLLQPEFVTEGDVAAAAEAAGKKKPLPALEKLRLRPFREGLSAQTLYLGPYADEVATIERMHAFIAEEGYALAGKHHEIYLSDPTRTAPERLKTVIRQPVRKA
jgi:hypothetical protein